MHHVKNADIFHFYNKLLFFKNAASTSLLIELLEVKSVWNDIVGIANCLTIGLDQYQIFLLTR